ncbi:Inositol phosphoceramide mannosyltransferase 3 [Mizuhopecten yessoensis]|uniref:Inositol phosphoceramide mannosyltransferase 3 n=1 Tax=Mizuhopecten yessoensis TaxID=6573 RepID=A0A210PEP3_MIZYE|nr:Inositol phosphoceramide mannosyltransferase 3 [Mizuhopecten yessoensis]
MTDLYHKCPEYLDSALLNTSSIADETVPSVTFGSRRFSHYVRTICPVNSERKVPNIIHYVWFDIKQMTFYQMISFLSVHKFQNPCLILLHGNVIPAGPYWLHLVRHVSNIIHVKSDGPIKTERNKSFNDNTHKSDLVRLMALKEFGGIYLDLDTVLLRSLDPLMNYPVTMSLEYWSNLSNGLIVAERDALFIRQWVTLFHEQYTYDPNRYFEFSLFMPSRIAKKHPSWIHVENMTFCTPNGQDTHKIFNENYDWKENYAMHLYIRYYQHHDSEQTVRTLNTTIGSLARYVLYGTKKLCED